jgi:4-alpha-glucanotransferase
MRVLQFAFGDEDSLFLPHHHTPNSVVYTGTHDNDTTRGWFVSLDASAQRRVLDYVGGPADEISWSLVREAMTSIADAAVVPMQDLLALGSEGRMNVPGVAEGNWTWRADAGAFDPALASRVRRLVEISGRLA